MTVWFGPDRLSANASWRLVQWTIETGADEFAFDCLLGSAREGRVCRTAEATLSPFLVGRGRRPALSRRQSEIWVSERQLWRLNQESLEVLRQFLPEGIFTDRQGSRDGWIENLTVYQQGGIRLGVITHEHEAALNLSEAERRQLSDAKILSL